MAVSGVPPNRFRKSSAAARAVAEGYRSGLEVAVADQLTSLGVSAEYEETTLAYTRPERPSKYTPDFILTNGVIVETKGRFVTADRQKHIHVKACHPQLDVRFVFSNPNAKIGKKSSTTYADWCAKNGFQFAHKLIPVEWINEPVSPDAIAAIRAATYKPKGR